MISQPQNMENRKSHSDSTNRTLHYVEVLYLKAGQYESRKFAHYPEGEAARMYLRTINKLKMEKRSSLVQLREENHQLIKSEMVSF